MEDKQREIIKAGKMHVLDWNQITICLYVFFFFWLLEIFVKIGRGKSAFV